MNVAMRPPRIAAPADRFVAQYEGLARHLPGDSAARAASAEILRRLGLPNVREEAWRFTNLTSLAATHFHEPHTATGEITGIETMPALQGFAGLPRLVFVQGHYSAHLSVLPPGISVSSFAENGEFGTAARPAHERMVALNTMLAEDGAVINVPENVDGGTLLLISLGQDGENTPMAFHPRHSIRVANGGKLALIEITSGHGAYLHNAVTDIHVSDGAQLTHVRLQDEGAAAFHFATIYLNVAASAAYHGFTLSVGAQLARTEFHARLTGSAAHITLNAAQLLRAHQHSDFTSVLRHEAAGCTSRQTVKHVLSGHARGVFQGKIEVARGAQQTDGYQMNQALLLSPDAEIDCKPQLEIYADDVKCSHGATVGALDPEQMFYLQSRGIGREEARAILVRAFRDEALNMVDHEAARAMLDGVIDQRWSIPA